MSTKSEYANKLMDPRWQRKRLQIFERDGFTCLDCGSTKRTLHVHHCLYFPKMEPWEYQDRYLRTLCDDCHEARGKFEKQILLEYKKLMATKTRHGLYEMSQKIHQEMGCDMLAGESRPMDAIVPREEGARRFQAMREQLRQL